MINRETPIRLAEASLLGSRKGAWKFSNSSRRNRVTNCGVETCGSNGSTKRMPAAPYKLHLLTPNYDMGTSYSALRVTVS